MHEYIHTFDFPNTYIIHTCMHEYMHTFDFPTIYGRFSCRFISLCATVWPVRQLYIPYVLCLLHVFYNSSMSRAISNQISIPCNFEADSAAQYIGKIYRIIELLNQIFILRLTHKKSSQIYIVNLTLSHINIYIESNIYILDG